MERHLHPRRQTPVAHGFQVSMLCTLCFVLCTFDLTLSALSLVFICSRLPATSMSLCAMNSNLALLLLRPANKRDCLRLLGSASFVAGACFACCALAVLTQHWHETTCSLCVTSASYCFMCTDLRASVHSVHSLYSDADHVCCFQLDGIQ